MLAPLILAALGQGTAQSTISAIDQPYAKFGRPLAVRPIANGKITDPNQVAVQSVALCLAGRKAELLASWAYPGKNAALGKALRTFIDVFADDLRPYQAKVEELRLVGYDLRGEVSVWYYELLDKGGKRLPQGEWVSLRRGQKDGLAALTGIFVTAPDIATVPPIPLKARRWPKG